MDEDSKTFVIYMIILKATRIMIHSFQETQIAARQWNKALTKLQSKYVDFAAVFYFDLAIKLLKNTSTKKYAIELVEGKQPTYRPIYALSLVEL